MHDDGGASCATRFDQLALAHLHFFKNFVNFQGAGALESHKKNRNSAAISINEGLAALFLARTEPSFCSSGAAT
jgi:hypothetical protein